MHLFLFSKYNFFLGYKKKVVTLHYIFKVERTLRVKGDLHIGGVMIKLVDSLGKMVLRSFLVVLQHW